MPQDAGLRVPPASLFLFTGHRPGAHFQHRTVVLMAPIATAIAEIGAFSHPLRHGGGVAARSFMTLIAGEHPAGVKFRPPLRLRPTGVPLILLERFVPCAAIPWLL